MRKVKEFLCRVKFVSWHDFLQIPLMVMGFVGSWFIRIRHNNIWLICERRGEARDNGFWFYKYLCEHCSDVEAVYAIDSSAKDYEKVARLGKTVPFGSLTHWAYYFAARRNVSSQKEGKPNAALCFVLEVVLGRVKNRAYIRHGIAKDRQEWVYYGVTKMNLFVCSATKEYDMVIRYFGYPEESVQLIGLCRFDNLLSHHEVKRQILVMPTMREWLREVSSDTERFEGSRDVSKSEYFMKWNSLLCNGQLHGLLQKYNLHLMFFPHASMQKHLHLFHTNSPLITIASATDYEVQQLLMESAILVTDYSSIFFDFAYMRKPLVYYQFDYEKYRRGQYKQGYFTYEEDGFGPVAHTETELLQHIDYSIRNGMSMPTKYKERLSGFFAYRDDRNCERTYQAISKMKVS